MEFGDTNTTFAEVRVLSVKKNMKKGRNKEKEFSQIISSRIRIPLTTHLLCILCVSMRLYNFVDFIVHRYFFPQENKYAIYIKVNGHL